MVGVVEKMVDERVAALKGEVETLRGELGEVRQTLDSKNEELQAMQAEMAEWRERPVAIAVPEQDVPVIEFEPVLEAAPLAEEPVAEPEPIREPEPVVEVQPQEEVSLFAPEEPETPVEEPAPVMEQVEGNQYGDLFSAAEPEPKKEAPAPEAIAEEPAKAKAQPMLFDYLGDKQQMTLAEKMGLNRRNVESDVENRMKQKKVDDLRQVININDKFSFMNELFHSNMKAYNDFVLKLNAQQTREEGLAVVEEVAQQYGWDENSLAVKTFFNYFDRKF